MKSLINKTKPYVIGVIALLSACTNKHAQKNKMCVITKITSNKKHNNLKNLISEDSRNITPDYTISPLGTNKKGITSHVNTDNYPLVSFFRNYLTGYYGAENFIFSLNKRELTLKNKKGILGICSLIKINQNNHSMNLTLENGNIFEIKYNDNIGFGVYTDKQNLFQTSCLMQYEFLRKFYNITHKDKEDLNSVLPCFPFLPWVVDQPDGYVQYMRSYRKSYKKRCRGNFLSINKTGLLSFLEHTWLKESLIKKRKLTYQEIAEVLIYWKDLTVFNCFELVEYLTQNKRSKYKINSSTTLMHTHKTFLISLDSIFRTLLEEHNISNELTMVYNSLKNKKKEEEIKLVKWQIQKKNWENDSTKVKPKQSSDSNYFGSNTEKLVEKLALDLAKDNLKTIDERPKNRGLVNFLEIFIDKLVNEEKYVTPEFFSRVLIPAWSEQLKYKECFFSYKPQKKLNEIRYMSHASMAYTMRIRLSYLLESATCDLCKKRFPGKLLIPKQANQCTCYYLVDWKCKDAVRKLKHCLTGTHHKGNNKIGKSTFVNNIPNKSKDTQDWVSLIMKTDGNFKIKLNETYDKLQRLNLNNNEEYKTDDDDENSSDEGSDIDIFGNTDNNSVPIQDDDGNNSDDDSDMDLCGDSDDNSNPIQDDLNQDNEDQHKNNEEPVGWEIYG